MTHKVYSAYELFPVLQGRPKPKGCGSFFMAKLSTVNRILTAFKIVEYFAGEFELTPEERAYLRQSFIDMPDEELQKAFDEVTH